MVDACLSIHDKAEIVKARENGMSKKAIAELFNCSETAVMCIVAKAILMENVHHSSKSRRPPLTTSQEDKALVLARKKNPNLNASDGPAMKKQQFNKEHAQAKQTRPAPRDFVPKKLDIKSEMTPTMIQRARTNQRASVPTNFIAKSQPIEREKWCAGKIPGKKAERFVPSQNSPKGTFLTRRTRPDLLQSAQQNWEIPRNQLQFGTKVGEGSFGKVYYGKWRDNVQVAIKTMKPGTMSPDAFLQEASIMKECNHPNLVKLHGVCTREEPFCIITEFMKNGSLRHYLLDDNSRQLDIAALVDIAAQVANGMLYLEERKLVHRDLAARNVLVGEEFSGDRVVKVADFGLARMLRENGIYEASTNTVFPVKWTAPEAATYGDYSVESDVWSFGILIYEIITRGQVPYPNMGNGAVLEQVNRGYRMPLPRNCPDKIYTEVMLRCWEKSPERRPSFEHLHHYLKNHSYRNHRSNVEFCF